MTVRRMLPVQILKGLCCHIIFDRARFQSPGPDPPLVLHAGHPGVPAICSTASLSSMLKGPDKKRGGRDGLLSEYNGMKQDFKVSDFEASLFEETLQDLRWDSTEQVAECAKLEECLD